MPDRCHAGLAIALATPALPASAQRLDQPGSVAEGGALSPLSRQDTAERCKRPTYRARARVECARSDADRVEIANRRAHRR